MLKGELTMNTGINLNIAGVEFDNDAEFALTF